MRSLLLAAILVSSQAQADGVLSPKQMHLARSSLATLKESMRNPASFSIINIRYVKKTNDVCFTYRAQNGFGGMNVERALYSAKDGYVSGEMYIWNDSGCIYHGGLDVTAEVVGKP